MTPITQDGGFMHNKTQQWVCKKWQNYAINTLDGLFITIIYRWR